MKLFSKSGNSQTSAVWIRLARIMMLLLLLVIVLTPITQSIWIGDNFFQAGGDTEYTLLMGATFVSLGLLLSKQKASAIKDATDYVRSLLLTFLPIKQLLEASSIHPFRTELIVVASATAEDSSFNLPLLI